MLYHRPGIFSKIYVPVLIYLYLFQMYHSKINIFKKYSCLPVICVCGGDSLHLKRICFNCGGGGGGEGELLTYINYEPVKD